LIILAVILVVSKGMTLRRLYVDYGLYVDFVDRCRRRHCRTLRMAPSM